MTEFHRIAKVGDIPAGEGRAFHLEGEMIAVFFVDGEYTAINDICPHMGASLASGYVEKGQVNCPWHAWRFDIRSGAWSDNPRAKICQKVYEVRVEGEEIQVRIPVVQ